MKLTLRRETTRPRIEETQVVEESTDTEAEPAAARTQPWSYGSQMGTKVIFGCLVASVVLGGPLGLYLGYQGQQRAFSAAEYVVAQSREQVQDPGLYIAAERAGQETVEAWLSATRTDYAWLQRLLPGAVTDFSLPTTAVEYSSVVPSGVTVGEDGLWLVTIAVSINENPIGEAEADAATPPPEPQPWPRRHYQVPVQVDVDRSTAAPVALPAAVGEPASETSLLGYTYDFALGSEIPTTVQAFLTALLAGGGEVDRYLMPGSEVDRFSASPYLDVSLSQVRAAVNPDALVDPADGETVRVRASVALTRPDGQTVPATYLLDLTSRSGRWEITSIDTTGATTSEGASS